MNKQCKCNSKWIAVLSIIIFSLVPLVTGCGSGVQGSTDLSFGSTSSDSGGSSTVTPIITACGASSGSGTTLTPGQSCTITGTGFNGGKGTTNGTITLVPQLDGGQNITVDNSLITVWNDTTIVFYVPSSVTAGIQYQIQVTVNTSSGSVAATYSGTTAIISASPGVNPPTISGINPTTVSAGGSISISGNNFGSTQNTSYVALTMGSSTYQLTITSWSNTSINATVPSSAASGSASVYVHTDTGGNSAASNITIQGSAPGTVTITNLNPSTVTAATVTAITITGTSFGASQGTSYVTFGTAQVASVTSWSATSIVVNTPSTLTVGNTNVSVTVGGVSSNTMTLTVVAAGTPVITTITPNSVQTGSSITITGTSFGASQGTGYVTFGSIKQSTVSNWSDTSVSCAVPTTAPNGTCSVKVTTSSGTTSAAYSITITTVTPPVAGAWHSPATSLSGTLGVNPAGFGNAMTNLQVFPNGNLVAIYQDRTAAAKNGVVAQFFIATTGTWSTAVQISDAGQGGTIANISSAMDGTGNILVCWDEVVTATNRIPYQYYNYGTGAWSGSIATSFLDTSNSPSTALTGNPSVAFDNVGNCVAVWRQINAPNAIIANKYTGGAWLNTPCQIQSIAAGVVNNGYASPVIAFKPGTQIGYAAWVQNSGADNGVYTRRVDTSKPNPSWNTLGSSWDTNASRVDFAAAAGSDASALTIRFNATNGMLKFEKIALPATTNLFVSQYNSIADQFTTIANAGSALNTTAIVAGSGGVGYLSNGNELAAWQDGTGTFPIYASTYNGIAWSGGQAIQCLTGGAVIGLPSIRCDSSGNAFCTFQQQQTTSAVNYLYAARYSNGAWTRPSASTDAIDGNTTANCCAFPSALAFNTAGNCWCLFTQAVGGVNKVFCNRYY